MKILWPLVLALCPVVAVWTLAQTADSPAPAPLKAGAAQVVITPETHMWMAGYAGRKKPAEGKVQDLFAKALVLEDAAGKRFVFVTTDLIGILPSLRSSIEEKVAAAHQLPPESLLLNASHTHSGPEYRVRAEREKEAQEYTAFLEQRLMEVIGAALADLKPAEVSWNRARAGFAMNRRLPTPKGYQTVPIPTARSIMRSLPCRCFRLRASRARCSSATPATTLAWATTNTAATTPDTRRSTFSRIGPVLSPFS